MVESLGATPAQIVVERAMYSNANGVVWAAGTNALATKLPVARPRARSTLGACPERNRVHQPFCSGSDESRCSSQAFETSNRAPPSRTSVEGFGRFGDVEAGEVAQLDDVAQAFIERFQLG